MSFSALAAAVMMGQASFSLVIDVPPPDRVDVAYPEILRGDNQAAMEKLYEKRLASREDPAVLINLGTVYKRLGYVAHSQEAFRAALTSSDRYQLELASGEWMDSRDIARLALRGEQIALR